MNYRKNVTFKIVMLNAVTAMLMVMALSCGQDPVNVDSNDDSVPFEVLTQHPHVSNCGFAKTPSDEYEVDDELSRFEMVITGKDEFDNWFNCREEMEEIDFEEFFVLAGISKGHHQCVEVRNLDVLVSNDALLFSVEIWEADCFVPETARYIVKVSAEYKFYPVEFNVFWGGPS